MRVSVRVSGGLAEELGAPRLSIALPDDATVADLLAHLRASYPQAERLSLALPIVAGQYASTERPLSADQEVALLLPVAGGSF